MAGVRQCGLLLKENLSCDSNLASLREQKETQYIARSTAIWQRTEPIVTGSLQEGQYEEA